MPSPRSRTRSALPLASSGHLGDDELARRPVAGLDEVPQRRRGSSGSSATTKATTRSPHSSSGTPSTSTARDGGLDASDRRGDGRGRDLHPAADDHVVGAAGHPQPAVVVEPAEVVGVEPAVAAAPRRSARARPRSRRTASVRAAAPRRPRRSGTSTPSSGAAVVHAAAAGLAHPVGLHDPDAVPLGLARGPRGERAAADQHRVEARERATSRPSGSSSSRSSWVGTSET